MKNLETLQLALYDQVAMVSLHRPERANAMNEHMLAELELVMNQLAEDDDVRVIVITGSGKNFSTGADLSYLSAIMEGTHHQPATKRKAHLNQVITNMQSAFNAIGNSPKPTIAAVHGYCIGAGVDLIAACDIRFCTMAALFSIMETKLGLAADLGTLQRLPHILSDGVLKELAYSSKFFSGLRAKEIGLVSKTYLNKSTLLFGAFSLAHRIAENPEEAVQATKTAINFAREHGVDASLKQIASSNAQLLSSEKAYREFTRMRNAMTTR